MIISEINNLPEEFINFIRVSSSIASRIKANIYLVGGIVRDLIIGRRSFDYDITVEGDGIKFASLTARELNTVFRKHHRFGTAVIYYKNCKIDITTCRYEHYSHWGALPRVRRASLKDDLSRRDFTINAMAVSLNNSDYGRLIDFHGGYKDLKNGIIRVMYNDSFLDDPTRMLRAVRFEKRFSFKIEKQTFHLFKEAAAKRALTFVNAQRLRDELILILKEPSPPKYIKRINTLIGFYFINENLNINSGDYYLLCRIERAIKFYKDRFPNCREVDSWIIYLVALVSKLSRKQAVEFCNNFRFRKKEEKILLGYFEHKKLIRYLKKEGIKKSYIYKLLNSLRCETLIFLYAFSKDKAVRNNIVLFLKDLADVKLEVNGYDLKKLGFRPYTLYSKILSALKESKIDKDLSGKGDEIAEAKKIFIRLKN